MLQLGPMACRSWLFVVPAALLGACGPQSGSGEDFVSDNPNGGDDSGEGTGAASSGGEDPGSDDGGNDSDEDDGGRDIAEADIVQIEGNRLYALSRLTGLTVIDVSTRDALPVLGRYRAHATPFEMYVDGDQLFVMYSSYGDYAWDDVAGGYVWHQASRLVALDASDPAAIEVTGEFEMPGTIQDSRRVGDVLYLVTHEDGYCWGCSEVQNTTVTSLDVSDPSQVKQVDQLSFDAPQEGYGGWRRSVSATDERMYVGGEEWLADEPGRSTIDVVDISDPGGALVRGTSFVVDGQINSRWQMDEHGGVLRVVSQPDDWSADSVPVVQTFQVNSAQEIAPLGRLEMRLPRPEQLRSVRFDGERGYAITFERTDPLFTLDLADPANPLQVGELEIPGWVHHMEPRGDRVLGLGFDRDHPEGSINVSLFDVSDFAQPVMLERVHFGEDWANFAEDQDRVHKAFTILDEEGLLLIPYEGWSYDDESPCGAHHSGVQLVDFTEDTLTKRGLAPAEGQARRAFLHDERLFSVGDKAVQTFDIADRDNPVSTGALQVAHNVSRSAVVGEHLVRISVDWWTQQSRLEVVPRDGADAAQPLGTLALDEIVAEYRSGHPEEGCGFYEAANAELLSHEGHVYMVFETWNYNDGGGRTHIAVFDVSDAQAPTFVQVVTLDGPLGWGNGYFAGLDLPGRRVVKAGSKLLLSRMTETYEGDTYKLHAQFEALDLSDPAQPRSLGTVERPAALQYGGLSVVGDEAFAWHAREVAGDRSKVAFYMDRVGLGDGADLQIVSVNVPGAPVAYSAATGRAITVDFRVETTEVDSEMDCYGQAKAWSYDYDRERCTLVHHEVAMVEIDGDRARLLGREDVEGELRLQGLAGGETRVFAEVGPGSLWGWEGDVVDEGVGGGPVYPEESSEVVVVTGLEGGALAVSGRVDLGRGYSSFWGSTVAGEHLLLNMGTGLGVVDARDPASPDLSVHELYGHGCHDMAVDTDRVHCSMGEQGMQTVPFGD